MPGVPTLVVVPAFLVVILAAFATAWLVRRRGGKPVGSGHAIGYIATAFAFILGLVLSTAIGHYNDARANAQAEAAKMTATLGSVSPMPTKYRNLVQNDLICVMKSIVNDEWPLMSHGDDSGSAKTNATSDKLFADIRALPTSNAEVSRQFGALTANVLAHGEMRDQRLVNGAPRVPLHVWLLLMVLAFVVVLFIALREEFPNRRIWIALSSLLALTIMATVAVMSMLDHPYQPGLPIGPYAMERSISMVNDFTGPTTTGTDCTT